MDASNEGVNELIRMDGKRPDDANLVQLSKRDVYICDRYADSHLIAVSSASGTAANEADAHKTSGKHAVLRAVAVEKSGVFDDEVEEFTK